MCMCIGLLHMMQNLACNDLNNSDQACNIPYKLRCDRTGKLSIISLVILEMCQELKQTCHNGSMKWPMALMAVIGGLMNALTARPPAVAQLRPNISSCWPHCPTPDPKLTRGGPITLMIGRLQEAWLQYMVSSSMSSDMGHGIASKHQLLPCAVGCMPDVASGTTFCIRFTTWSSSLHVAGKHVPNCHTRVYIGLICRHLLLDPQMVLRDVG